jgi:hypothetical protein
MVSCGCARAHISPDLCVDVRTVPPAKFRVSRTAKSSSGIRGKSYPSGATTAPPANEAASNSLQSPERPRPSAEALRDANQPSPESAALVRGGPEPKRPRESSGNAGGVVISSAAVEATRRSACMQSDTAKDGANSSTSLVRSCVPYAAAVLGGNPSTQPPLAAHPVTTPVTGVQQQQLPPPQLHGTTPTPMASLLQASGAAAAAINDAATTDNGGPSQAPLDMLATTAAAAAAASDAQPTQQLGLAAPQPVPLPSTPPSNLDALATVASGSRAVGSKEPPHAELVRLRALSAELHTANVALTKKLGVAETAKATAERALQKAERGRDQAREKAEKRAENAESELASATSREGAGGS